MRVRIVRKVENFNPGDTVNVDAKVAKFLLKNGYAIQSKDITESEYRTK